MLRAALRTMVGLAGSGVVEPVIADNGLTKDITFGDYSALSSSAQLARRLLTPLAYERLQPHLGDARAQPLDLAQEKFAVYVPPGAAPAQGYGLLVFIPPWPDATLPSDWPRVLDRRGLIFITAANSGNDAATLDRRIPLALLAYENIRRRYPIDAERVYVGGLSGGSRVALRVALAYPDVFRGALLNAGSDPIGDEAITPPPADLLRRFQSSTRVVFLTGERDEVNVHNDLVSQRSLRSWCAFALQSVIMPRRGHAIADAAGLARALEKLDEPAVTPAERIDACRADLDRALAADVAKANAALASGDRERATSTIDEINARYGGFAAAQIKALEIRLDRH